MSLSRRLTAYVGGQITPIATSSPVSAISAAHTAQFVPLSRSRWVITVTPFVQLDLRDVAILIEEVQHLVVDYFAFIVVTLSAT